MGQLTKPSVIKQYMNKYNFYFKKDLGQNFLIDDNAANRIVDALELTGTEIVLEIGPGIGALTEILVQKAKHVIVVEIDPFAIKMLSEIFSAAPNLTIIHADILKTDLHQILSEYIANGEKLSTISNLPYYITSPVLMKLLESRIPFASIVVMMQKEVAARLGSKLSTKDYSAFTIVLDYYARVERLFDITRNCFMPAPNVDSAVVKILPRKEPAVCVKSETMFFKTVHAAFATRRKTILNCISAGFELDKASVKQVLADAEIDENLRAENITIERFAVLSDRLSEIIK